MTPFVTKRINQSKCMASEKFQTDQKIIAIKLLTVLLLAMF